MIRGTKQDNKTLWERIVKAFGADTDDIGTSDWSQLEQALAHVSELSEQLEKQNLTLPHLDTHKHIYPEMEERYATKEEWEKELSAAVERTKELLPQLMRTVKRRQKNLDLVRSDAGKLNQPEVQKGYSQAEEAARKQYMEALHYKDRTIATLRKAQSILAVASKKKFPGREPRRQDPSRPNEADAVQDSHGISGGAVEQQKDADETDDLISLGPLANSANAIK